MANKMLYPRNTLTRQVIDLSGMWKFSFDFAENGEESGYPTKGLKDYIEIPVPASYNDFFTEFDQEKFHTLVAKVGLSEEMKMREISTGMMAKLKVIATLSRNAMLYMLDEPLNGVDYKAREDIISLILEEADENRTFVISTHLIEEVETFIEEAIFIRNGELVKLVNLEQERAAGGRSLAEIYLSVM